MSLSANVNEKANLIWAIADKLTGVYKPHEYGKVILPLTVIRRFDCILADTKQAVLDKHNSMAEDFPMREQFLKKTSGYEFYNTSKYTIEILLDDANNIEANFKNYLNGFSANVRQIIDKFEFNNEITKLADKNLLYIVIQEFTTPKADLHPHKISNLEMGYIFEEIIRRFSEAHNEDAGQHYTPREVIELMVNILFTNDNDILTNNVAKTIYDPACGTGGMLSVAEDYLKKLNSSATLLPFGQEINDETFAICKADMLIKGNDADKIRNGNTLSDDNFKGETFDYILSNPPFGREWKNDKKAVEDEAKLGAGGRFGAGLPAVGDGQMLFLQTAIAKMKDRSQDGSKIAIIHNGSPLFTGDAESQVEANLTNIGDVDLFKAGHHGSDTSNTSSLLNRIKPEHVVIMAGANNKYGHPSAEVMNRFKSLGIPVYRTDEQGTIIVTLSEDGVSVDKEPGSYKSGDGTQSSSSTSSNSSNSTSSEASSNSSNSTSSESSSQESTTTQNKDDNPNGVHNQQSTAPQQSYQNCTLLRQDYPDGVPQGHPAYASKHDRDKDGWACER